ncbi:hypothetical protein EVAR_34587_1 [Eumeta japonica]|uniref:Uncharacterized protein n=1 Tax=Eumeta variegata TaxID=151549 RepID=A0A4C1VGT6_EUMVA|nr:hypothetical protein EVAR_34587_1 [Eumeta japonica]
MPRDKTSGILLRKTRRFGLCARAGTAGYELADEVARGAALKKKTAADYDRFPLSAVDEAYKVLSRVQMMPLLTQTLTGHGGFAQYLYKFKLKNSRTARVPLTNSKTYCTFWKNAQSL